MGDWFFGFESTTTVKEVKEVLIQKFKDESDKVLNYRKNLMTTHKGPFDCLITLILGGYSNCKGYGYEALIGGNSILIQSTSGALGFGSKNRVTSQVESRIQKIGIKETDTLADVLNKVNGLAELSSGKKKLLQKVLQENGSYVQIGMYGSNQKMKNVDDIVSKEIESNKQVIFTGAPGTGKTYSVREYVKKQCTATDGSGVVDEKQYKFVQFHPSYDYSDFVEGLRPVVIQGQTESTFVRLDGVFKAFCRYIVGENAQVKNATGKESHKKFYFVVDEINRADLAKVFGELMFGLEESYRGEKNSFDTQYKNLVTYKIIDEGSDKGKAIPMEEDVFKDGFYIPENLYFIGTMNDIDRSVDSMDFALRRRFMWVDIKANEIMNSSLHSILDRKNKNLAGDKIVDIDELANRIIEMNNEISKSKFGLTEAYHIGPAYFKNLDITNHEESLELIFKHNITSILKEYTRGRKQDEVDKLIDSCEVILLGE